MSNFELHVSPTAVFSGSQNPLEKSSFVVIGLPFDLTSTYRSGARFAPRAIREASLNIETYSFRSNVDAEDLKIHDLGDLHISHNLKTTITRVSNVVRDLLNIKKTPVLLGGEHTITLGALHGVGKDVAVISFDAHLDLRNRYLDLTTSHTTFMRRANEQVKPGIIIELGTRAVCKEELTYIEKSGIQYFTSELIKNSGINTVVEVVKEAIESYERIYLTIDMDVLDPAFAPAVQNPEPLGLSPNVLLEMITRTCDHRVVCMDLVEVTPIYDNGVTAIVAAKTLFEILCHLEKYKRN